MSLTLPSLQSKHWWKSVLGFNDLPQEPRELTPQSAVELRKAWAKWGEAYRFIHPVYQLAKGLQEALEAEGFGVVSKVPKAFRVFDSLSMLTQSVSLELRHPDGKQPIELQLIFKLHENGKAQMGLEFIPGGKACGLAQNASLEFLIRDRVQGIRPHTWLAHAREACTQCFDTTVWQNMFPYLPETTPLRGMQDVVMGWVRNEMAV